MSMSSKNPSQDAPKGSPFWSSVKLLLLVVLIALVPIASREIDLDPDNVRLVGRCAAGVGVIVILYALIKQMAKIVTVLAIALLTLAVLVSEGLIDLPRFMS